MFFYLVGCFILGCVLTFSWKTCPDIDSFLTFMSGVPLPHACPLAMRESLGTMDQLGHALIRARVAAAIETESHYLVFRRIRLCSGVRFYGCLGCWNISGRRDKKKTALKRVVVYFRDSSPMLDLYQHHDPAASHWIAHEWQHTEQIFVEQGPDLPIRNFRDIAQHLMSIPSSVAKIDAALACLMGWHYATRQQTMDEDAAIWFLTRLADLVKIIAPKDPQLVQWIGITVADQLTELGHDTYDLCESLAAISTWPRDDLFFRCISNVAEVSLMRGKYDMAVRHSKKALKYYRECHELDINKVGRLAYVRSVSLMALERWDEWLGDRSLIESFGMATPELIFLAQLYRAWTSFDILLFESACRDLDRVSSISDAEIDHISKAKHYLQNLATSL
ncbi:hypothetical protein BX666DRAFT_1987884 [Dichotomocladium elegans]|nr:hypothetical protein BX666DRAFT_1987884 [Dichotomocladium elegans]